MLGPRSHRTPEAHRRDRRRIAIGVAIGIVVAVVLGEVINDIVNSSPPTARRTEATWIAAVAGIIAESNTLAQTIHAVRAHATDAASYDRETLELALSGLARASSEQATAFETLGFQAPSASAGSLVADALTGRADGLSELARGVTLALSPKDTAATSTLAAAGAQLVAADSAYRRAVKLVGHKNDGGGLPDSWWIKSPGQWSSSAVGAWARTLSTAPNLLAAPAIAIVAMTLEPPPLRITGLPTTTLPSTSSTTTSSTTTTTAVGSSTTATSTTSTTSTTTTSTLPGPTTTSQIPPSGSLSIIAATRHVRVIAVVQNTGNVEIRGARVVVLLVLTSRSAHGLTSAKQTVPRLEPGASAYLVFAKLPVTRSSSYKLLVTATLSNRRAVRRSIAIEVGG
ncbi:MAG TPA: hypothetical protein VKR27_04560 [Acidimicrobiales bacterium]|nr:hypothetical protein [Acidimicrobiales bacterium]